MRSIFRHLLISTGKFLQRMEFFSLLSTVIAMLGLVLPLIPGENLSNFFKFNTVIELLKYIGSILLILFVLLIISQIVGTLLLYWGRSVKVNLKIIEYIQPDDFTHQYVSLKIVNNEKEDLTDCIAIMETVERFYNKKDGVEDILTRLNPNHLSLTWGGGSRSYVIPSDGGKKIINIGRAEGTNGKFVFIFDNEWESEENFVNIKYHVVIKINGKINGEPFKAKYEGCFRLRNYEQSQIWVEFIDCTNALNDDLLDLISVNS